MRRPGLMSHPIYPLHPRMPTFGRLVGGPAPAPITGTSPTIAPMTEGSAMSSAVTWPSFSSSAGTIASTTREISYSGGDWETYDPDAVVSPGQTVQVRHRATDSVGNVSDWFISNTITVAYGALSAVGGTIPIEWAVGEVNANVNVTGLFSGGTVTAYAVQSGSLPVGATLNTSTGVITPPPSPVAGSGSFTIRASNPLPSTADQSFTWEIAADSQMIYFADFTDETYEVEGVASALSSILTMTRTGVATRWTGGGRMEDLGTNAPRPDFRLGAGLGRLLIEPARTNVLFHTADLTQWTAVGTLNVNTASGVDAPNPDYQMCLTSGGTGYRRLQSWTPPAAGQVLLYFVTRPDALNVANSVLQIQDGASNLGVRYNVGTGLAEIAQATGNITGAVAGILDLPGGWKLVYATATFSVALSGHQARFYGNGSLVTDLGLIRLGQPADSHIPSGASAGARGAETAITLAAYAEELKVDIFYEDGTEQNLASHDTADPISVDRNISRIEARTIGAGTEVAWFAPQEMIVGESFTLSPPTDLLSESGAYTFTFDTPKDAGWTLDTVTGEITGRCISRQPAMTFRIRRGGKYAFGTVHVVDRAGVEIPPARAGNANLAAMSTLGMLGGTETNFATTSALTTAMNVAAGSRGTPGSPNVHRLKYNGVAGTNIGSWAPNNTSGLPALNATSFPEIDTIVVVDCEGAVFDRILPSHVSYLGLLMVFSKARIRNSDTSGTEGNAVQFDRCQIGLHWDAGLINPSTGHGGGMWPGGVLRNQRGTMVVEGCHIAGLHDVANPRYGYAQFIGNFCSHISNDFIQTGGSLLGDPGGVCKTYGLDNVFGGAALSPGDDHPDYLQVQNTGNNSNVDFAVTLYGDIVNGDNVNYAFTLWRDSGSNQNPCRLRGKQMIALITGWDVLINFSADVEYDGIFAAPAMERGANLLRFNMGALKPSVSGTPITDSYAKDLYGTDFGWNSIWNGKVTDYTDIGAIDDNLQPDYPDYPGTVKARITVSSGATPTAWIPDYVPHKSSIEGIKALVALAEPPGGWASVGQEPLEDRVAGQANHARQEPASLVTPTLTGLAANVVGSAINLAATMSHAGCIYFTVHPANAFPPGYQYCKQGHMGANGRAYVHSRYRSAASGAVSFDINTINKHQPLVSGTTYYLCAMMEHDSGGLSAMSKVSFVCP